MKRIYLDHAAATPIDSKIVAEVSRVAKAHGANPSALHREGVAARAVLEGARRCIGEVLSAHADEIVFTGTATEANNLALQGVVRAARSCGIVRPHIIVSAIEHPSVLRTGEALARQGVDLDIVPVDARGIVDLKALRKLIRKETVLISVMYVNNEIGTIEPIKDVAKEARHARKIYEHVFPYVHTDGAQASAYMNLNVLELGIDLMTLSSGKVYGSRGIACLFVKRGVGLAPLIYGGEHERGLRPGTEAPALAEGFARALTQAQALRSKESTRVASLRDLLARELERQVPRHVLNTTLDVSAPHILNISIPGVDSETLVLYLDAAGIAVSGKSACESSVSEVSHVILALGKGQVGEAGTLRFSLGRSNTPADMRTVARALARVLTLISQPSASL